MRIEHSFPMRGATPEEAQQRFLVELAPQLKHMGFALDEESAGHLAFRVRYVIGDGISWWLSTGVLTVTIWLWRLAVRHRLEVDFLQAADGCVVAIYGRAGRGVGDLLALLGRNSHWPERRDDPEWLAPELVREPLEEWGDEVDPGSVDRITRRALKRAGRLAD